MYKTYRNAYLSMSDAREGRSLAYKKGGQTHNQCLLTKSARV